MKSKRVSFSWRATRRRRWASPGTAQNARNTSTDIARPHEKANVAQRPAKREASFSFFFLSLFFFIIPFSISLWRDASRSALCAPWRNSSDTKRRPKNIYPTRMLLHGVCGCMAPGAVPLLALECFGIGEVFSFPRTVFSPRKTHATSPDQRHPRDVQETRSPSQQHYAHTERLLAKCAVAARYCARPL